MIVRPRRVLPYGPRALLAEYERLEDVTRSAAVLRALSPPGVLDIVPAAATILVTHDGADPDAVVRILHEAVTSVDEWPTAADGSVVIGVRYDGVDLAEIAERCGARIDDVVTWHSSPTYTVAFCGFMPGFAYMTGLDARLHLPRRSTPRPKVDSGSVAIAGEFSAVYPAASPGGWHLLGTTDAVMWDESRDVPALLPPGTRVRFEPA